MFSISDQRKSGSVCTALQSDQGLHCSLIESFHSIHYVSDHCRLWSDCAYAQALLSRHWSHFVISSFSIWKSSCFGTDPEKTYIRLLYKGIGQSPGPFIDYIPHRQSWDQRPKKSQHISWSGLTARMDHDSRFPLIVLISPIMVSCDTRRQHWLTPFFMT